MKTFTDGRRYVATDNLRSTLVAQGRQAIWLARQIGVTKGHFSHVVSGKRSVEEQDARLIAALLGTDFFLLWEVPKRTNMGLLRTEALEKEAA